MPTYNYIDKTGAMASVDAPDSTTALKIAPNIKSDSGVMLLRSTQGAGASSNPAPLTGTQTGNTDIPPGTNPTGTGTSTLSASAQSILDNIKGSANNPSAMTTAKNNLISLFSNPPAAPDQNTILQQKQQAAQLLINQINAEFGKTYQDANTANAAREARIRALTSSSGLGGSNVASSNIQKGADQSAKNIELIDNERNAKINEVLGRIGDQASEEYRKARQDYLAEINNDWAKVNEFQTSEMALAKSNIASLAGAGVTVAALKAQAPDTYKQLLEQSGMTEAVFNAAYNAGLPENQKVAYSYQKIGNDLYAIHTDPATKKIVTEKIASPDGQEYDKFVIAPDGTPLFINTKTGVATEASGNYAKPPAPKSGPSNKTTYTQAELTSALDDAYNAIYYGANPDAVRRAFLQDFPNESAKFNSYTKKTGGRTT